MIEAIWVLIIGIILLALGGMKKAGTYSNFAVIAGVILLVVGAVWPGYGIWESNMSIIDDSSPSTAGAQLDIACDNATSGGFHNSTLTIDEDARTITVTLRTAEAAATGDKLKRYEGAVNFTITPIAPAGADDNSLINVKASTNEEATFENDDVFYLSAGEYTCDWHKYYDAGTTTTWHGDDDETTHTMKVTDTDCLQLRWRLSQNAADTFGANLRSVGETYSLPITISSGSNSYTYSMIFVVVAND